MSKYNPHEFINKIYEKFKDHKVPSCPFCGGNKFTSTDSLAYVLIGKDLDNVSIGPSMPSGILVCEKCGHIELFALGALGLLHKEEAVEDV